MKTGTWLSILTLGLGWGLAQVTEVLKDRRPATGSAKLARPSYNGARCSRFVPAPAWSSWRSRA
jgi:hypothetical protein